MYKDLFEGDNQSRGHPEGELQNLKGPFPEISEKGPGLAFALDLCFGLEKAHNGLIYSETGLQVLLETREAVALQGDHEDVLALAGPDVDDLLFVLHCAGIKGGREK